MIYIFPSAIVSLICAIGMWSLKDEDLRPDQAHAKWRTRPQPRHPDRDGGGRRPAHGPMSKRERFTTPQNLLGVLFLAVLAFNLLVMALDFPRFELVGVILLDPLRCSSSSSGSGRSSIST